MTRLIETLFLASTLVVASAVGLAAETPWILPLDGIRLDAALRDGADVLAARAEDEALSLCVAADPEAALGSDALVACVGTLLHDRRVHPGTVAPR